MGLRQPLRMMGTSEKHRRPLHSTSCSFFGVRRRGVAGASCAPHTALRRRAAVNIRESRARRPHCPRRPKKKPAGEGGLFLFGEEGGIRTHGTLASTPVFETDAFNHSATSPRHATYKGRRECSTPQPLLARGAAKVAALVQLSGQSHCLAVGAVLDWKGETVRGQW